LKKITQRRKVATKLHDEKHGVASLRRREKLIHYRIFVMYLYEPDLE
jgi:hypothetical protein